MLLINPRTIQGLMDGCTGGVPDLLLAGGRGYRRTHRSLRSDELERGQRAGVRALPAAGHVMLVSRLPKSARLWKSQSVRRQSYDQGVRHCSNKVHI